MKEIVTFKDMVEVHEKTGLPISYIHAYFDIKITWEENLKICKDEEDVDAMIEMYQRVPEGSEREKKAIELINLWCEKRLKKAIAENDTSLMELVIDYAIPGSEMETKAKKVLVNAS